MAVPHRDATPSTSTNVVHHLSGRHSDRSDRSLSADERNASERWLRAPIAPPSFGVFCHFRLQTAVSRLLTSPALAPSPLSVRREPFDE